MKLRMKVIHGLLMCSFLMSGPVVASVSGSKKVSHQATRTHHDSRNVAHRYVSNYVQFNHYEAIVTGGVANLWAGNSHINVTRSETDRLVQSNDDAWKTIAGQLGAGYIYYFHETAHPTINYQWFPAIEPQLNLYYLSNNSGIRGNVWRFNSANFNQLTYKIPVRSTRLMLDAALTVVKKKKSSLYIKAGIGNAWSRLSYSDRDNVQGTCSNQRISLNAKTYSNFAWEAGAGVLYDFNNSVGVSLEYLYTNFGSVKTSSHASIGTITTPVTGSVRFTMQAQAGLLGLHVAL